MLSSSMKPPREGTLKRFQIITVLSSAQITNISLPSITARAHRDKDIIEKISFLAVRTSRDNEHLLSQFLFAGEAILWFSVQADQYGVASTLKSCQRKGSSCPRVGTFFSTQKGHFSLRYLPWLPSGQETTTMKVTSAAGTIKQSLLFTSFWVSFPEEARFRGETNDGHHRATKRTCWDRFAKCLFMSGNN